MDDLCKTYRQEKRNVSTENNRTMEASTMVSKGQARNRVRDFVEDYVESEQPDKSDHEWAQSIKEALHSIQGITRPGDLVVDPFMGSGTTGIAALMTNRRFTGIEIDVDKYSIAKARLQKYLDTAAEQINV